MQEILEAGNVKEILEAVKQKATYHGDRVSAGGGCEAAVIARTTCWWDKVRACGELLYGRFPLKLKGTAYKYVSSAMLFQRYMVPEMKQCGKGREIHGDSSGEHGWKT